MFHDCVSTRILSGLTGITLCMLPSALGAETPAYVLMTHQLPGWAEQLKGQTIIEDVIEGQPDRAVVIERQHQRIMKQIEQDAAAQRTGGYYNNTTTMHQYGAGNQDALLMSNVGGEAVSRSGGRYN